MEILYINYIRQSTPNIILISIAGIFAGQLINYWLGRSFGFLFRIRERTKYKIQQRLDRYGFFFVTFAHTIPFPFQAFNLVSGILKYRFPRWMLFVLLGLTIKHFVIFWVVTQYFV